eukprot:366278-Chlamydomonas_euryale.AAC.41
MHSAAQHSTAPRRIAQRIRQQNSTEAPRDVALRRTGASRAPATHLDDDAVDVPQIAGLRLQAVVHQQPRAVLAQLHRHHVGPHHPHQLPHRVCLNLGHVRYAHEVHSGGLA